MDHTCHDITAHPGNGCNGLRCGSVFQSGSCRGNCIVSADTGGANAEENPTTPPSSDTAADDVSDQQEPSPAQNPSADDLTDSESQLQPQSISLLLSHL